MPHLSASPAAKSKEVFEALEAMESATHLNEFEVKKLEREAERLVKADAESGYTVLGVIAAMRRGRRRRTCLPQEGVEARGRISQHPLQLRHVSR